MISSDNELNKYVLSDEEWVQIEEIKDLMEVCIYIIIIYFIIYLNS